MIHFNHICLSCKSSHLYEDKSFTDLPRATSDCTPFPSGGTLCICLQCGLIQKKTDAKWHQDIQKIYDAYAMYALTGGAEQVLFSEDGAARSKRILDIVSQKTEIPAAGEVIDIGCGTGGFLRSFAEKFPTWKLYGKELDDRNETYLSAIPHFQKLFTQDIAIDRKFDAICAIHTFEHLDNYDAFFAGVKKMQKDVSTVLIQVPDVASSPFDILVADHAAHFSRETLDRTLRKHLEHLAVYQVIRKELTAIASPKLQPDANDRVEAVDTEEDLIASLQYHVHYLKRLLEYIDAQRLSAFAVYGTTIAAAWLAGIYKDKIAFYVDDDPLKQGKEFQGKEIVSAAGAARDCKIFMPFEKSTIHAILDKNKHLLPYAFYLDKEDTRLRASA